MKVDYQTMLELIKQNVHEVDAAAQVWLYGSRARGEAHDDSDWDVLVLSPKEKLTFKEEEQFMDHICDVIGIRVILLLHFIRMFNRKQYCYE